MKLTFSFLNKLAIVIGLLFMVTGYTSPAFAAKDSAVVQVESALEKRVRQVASKLRCPVCQGESVYDSHADVAVEMKNLIQDKLVSGASETEILDYFQARYGNYILMAPPVSGLHWVIWVFPVFLGLVGTLLVYQHISHSNPSNKPTDHQSGSGKTDHDETEIVGEGQQKIEELQL